ncbi:capsid cement protein [Massilia sp. Root418]|uniref:capsid cement protein n=1 Tax=Massilia sp. Root418 TaxID=1736532 RepID=UPI000AD99784|nr:capsid cement protein [Massilia sp. Root418]
MAAAAIKLLTLSAVATAVLSANRAVTAAGAVPVAGGRCAGFTDFPAAIGERVSYGALGTVVAEAGAAFAVDAALELDATGRVITKASGVAVARALGAASAAGQLVEILVIPN